MGRKNDLNVIKIYRLFWKEKWCKTLIKRVTSIEYVFKTLDELQINAIYDYLNQIFLVDLTAAAKNSKV